MTTLRRRLFVAVLAAIVASVALTIALGAVLARRTAEHNDQVALARQADLLAANLELEPSYIASKSKVGSATVIVDVRAKMKQYGIPLGHASNGHLRSDGTLDLYSYRPAGTRDLLVLQSDTRPTEWGSFLRDLGIAGFVGAVLAAIISFLLARSVVAPIGRVAAASRALAEGTSPEPLPTQGTAELAEAARAFNEMAEQLTVSRESERNFLLSVSHELKTPLTAIRGYAEGLGEGVFSPEEAARTVLVETRRLERLVRDLLDLARMNRHAFQVQREPVDLAEVAREVVARHETAAREFGVALTAEGEASWVEADHDRVIQVASNLVENALRETPRDGAVTVHVEPGTLSVSDTGPGLDDDDVPHAFDRFFLYDKYGRERPVGSGLGLAIVKQLSQAMGGDVSITTARGAGATFIVRLPSGSELRRVHDLEVGAGQTAE